MRVRAIGVPLQRHLSLLAVHAILVLLTLLFCTDSLPCPGSMRGWWKVRTMEIWE
jgi:hypothetical protein